MGAYTMRLLRVPGRTRSWRLTVALLPLLAGSGCALTEQLIAPPQQQVFVNGQLQPQASVKADAELVENAKSGKQRTPKASSCVAHGDWLRSCGDMSLGFAKKAETDARRASLKAQASQQYAVAKQRYWQALQLDPNEVGAHVGLARVAVAENQFDTAQKHYQAALKLQPNSAAIHFEIGMTLARMKNWEPALASLKRAAELDPANPTIATNYAWTLARAERFEEAWQTFRPLVGEGQAYYRLALMTRHLGRNDLAKAYLTYALQRDPSLKEAHEMLANLNQPAAPQGPNSVPDAGAVVPAGYMQPQ